MTDDDTGGNAFLDVAANTLAIIIMITMFALLTLQRTVDGSDHAAAIDDPPLPFIARSHQLFQPFSDYWFVLEEGLVRWDQDALVEALLAGGYLAGAVATHQGRGELERAAIIFHDLDGFRVTFYPDLERLGAEAAATDPKQLGASLIERYRDRRVAPVFLVYAEGMDVFAELYEELDNERVRLRWFPWQADDPLTVVRNVNQFTMDETRW